MKKIYILITIFCLNFVYAQSPTCATASAFCAGGSTLTFGNSTNVPSVGTIGCLSTTPNPAWFYMTVSQSGTLNFLLTQGSNAPNYNNQDVDFIVWGPFNAPNCTDLYGFPVGNTSVPNNVVDCSYSGSATENVDITGAIAGQVYMVLITNFSNQAGQITLTQTNLGLPGAGATDCNVVCGVSLGPDELYCNSAISCHTINANFNSPTTQPGTPVFVWYLDTGSGPVLQPAFTTQSITVCQGGTWSVLATRPGCSAPSSDEIFISFSAPPIINTPPNIVDSTGNCNPTFDLTSNIPAILGSLNPANYNITFHLDLFESFSGINPIPNPITYTTTTTTTIYVSVANSNNQSCAEFTEFDVVVNCTATATMPPDMIVCDDITNNGVEIFDLTSQEALILNGLDPTLYTITFHTSLANANGDINAIPTPTAYSGGPNQVIYVRLESNIDTTVYSTTTFNLIVNPLPTAAIGTSTICEGTTAIVTFSGTPNATVNYTFDDGTSGPIAQTPVVLNASGTASVTSPILTSNAIYTLVDVTSTANCTRLVNGTATVIVNPLPTVSISTTTPSICDGTSATINFTGTPNATITYTINGVSNTIVLNASGTASVTANTTSTYCLVNAASSSTPVCNKAFTDCVTITVIPLPTVTISGDAVCAGDTATVTFTGTPGATVNYNLGATAQTPVVLDTTTGIATVTTTSPFGTYTYTVVDVTSATSPPCTATIIGQVATVTVLNSPVINPVSDIRVCDDDNNGFAVFNLTPAVNQAQGVDPTLTVTVHETQTGADFDTNAFTAAQILAYSNNVINTQPLFIRVENAAGCYSTTSFFIIVDPRPALNQTVTPYELCETSSPADGFEVFDLTNAVTTASITNGATGLTLTYYTSLADAQVPQNAIVNPATYTNTTVNQQTIWVVGQNALGCRHITSFIIRVNPLPTITPLSPMNGCSDGVNPNSAPFNLTLNDALVTNGQPGFTVTYHLTQANANSSSAPLASPYNSISNPQIVFVRVQDNTTGCFDTTTLQLNVTQGPTANQPTNLTYCDPDNDGYGSFDLQSTLTQISAGPTPSGVAVTFHETLADAMQEPPANPIVAMPYLNNVQNVQTIYVAVSYTLTGCTNYTQFDLIVNPTPVLVTPDALEACDDAIADGMTQFNLTQANAQILGTINPATVQITYHLTNANAQAGTPQITNVLSYTNTTPNLQTIYVRVQTIATGCFKVVPLDLIVNPRPIMPTPESIVMTLCDDNNSGNQQELFDLTGHIPNIVGTQTNMNVTFHLTQAQALAGTNQLSSPYQNTSNTQSIFVRVENAQTGCFDVVILDLRVEPLPILLMPAAAATTLCDSDGDGFSTFDLTALEANMLNGAPNVTISFYETVPDANANPPIPAIANPSAYMNIDPYTQMIYVLATNTLTGCKNVYSLILKVNAAPIMPTLPNLVECDNNYDGFRVFDLTQQNAAILAANPTITSPLPQIRYYQSLANATNGTAAIVNPNTYTNQSNPQTIWVVVRDTSTGCTAMGSFDLIVNVPVNVSGQNNELTLCDDGPTNDQVTTFDLTVLNPQIIGTSPVSAGATVVYYTSLANAQTATNPIATPTAFVNTVNPQNVWAVVTTTAGCKSIALAKVRVVPSPTPFMFPTALEVCDDDQTIIGSELFDVTQNQVQIQNGFSGLVFEYYPTQADAIAGTNMIPNPTAYEGGNATATPPTNIVYIKVKNAYTDFYGNNCYKIVEQELIVNPLPVVVDTTYVICDDDSDGFATFTLSDYNAQLLGSTQAAADFTITYYNTQVNAQGGTATGLLPNTYTNTVNPQMVYPRVVNNATGCVNALAEVTLMVKLRAIANPISQAILDTFTKCDYYGANDGVEQFDLTAVESDLLGTQTSPPINITYHLNLMDQSTGLNAIANTTAFENTSNPQTIFIRVERANTDPLDTTAKCYDVAQIELNVELLAEPVITSSTGYEIICVDFNTGALISGLTLDSGIPQGTGYTYQWALNGTAITGAVNATYDIVTVAPGTYSVVVTSTSPQGCVSAATSDSTFEVVQSGPAANLQSFINGSFEEVQTITITFEGYGTYEFQLDGQGPWQSSPVFTNVPAGTHFVLVRDVTNPDYACDEQQIDNVSIINYPHFFTPNGDGINDNWNITGLSSQTNAKIYIFDRYGKLLKQISPTSPGWNGTFNGQPLPATDYWFTVDYFEITPTGALTPKQFKAHFSLKR